MKNKNYPHIFDEKIADDAFLDSLHAIANEPLSNKIASFIHPVRSVGMVIFLLFYGNSIFESLSKIYLSNESEALDFGQLIVTDGANSKFAEKLGIPY